MARSEITSYSVRLDTRMRRDGREWVVCCPSIDVATQARTKKKAMESLTEAVQLWFESCIERGVLDEALAEVGFNKVPADQEIPENRDSVRVVTRPQPEPAAEEVSFSLGRDKGSEYIAGIIPAFLAARQLGNAARARG